VGGDDALVWDRLGVHRIRAVSSFIRRHRRLHVEWLPPYAPELDPVEQTLGRSRTNTRNVNRLPSAPE
jgi:transposase